MSEPIRAVLFDVDGTLVDSVPFLVECFCWATQEVLGRGVEPGDVRAMIGLPLGLMFSRVDPALDERVATRCVDAYRERYLPDALARSPMFDDALPVLCVLHGAGLRLAAVSGKTSEGIRRVLAPSGAFDLLSAVVGADSGHPPKPAPEAALAAATLLGVAPGQALVVGDSLLDIGMGAAAGMRTCGVATGAYARELLEPAADVVIDRLAELPSLLRALG